MKSSLEARLTYRENAVRSATPIELVVILFDAAIEDMRRAVSAIQASDVEERANAVRHAMLVLQQLQGTLDFERGGQVARQFEQFYNLIRAKLLESQLRNSPELIGQQIQFMSEVRDCWVEAKKRIEPQPVAPAEVPSPALAKGSLEDGGPTAEWSA
jgi:flagellar protein FliS